MRIPGVLVAFLCVLLLAAPAVAQTTAAATPTEVQILVIPATGDASTVTPVKTVTAAISTTSPACNQANPSGVTPATLTNPTRAYFDDPFNAGKSCTVLMPTGIPAGSYRAVAVFNGTCVNGTTSAPCSSPRSEVAVPPFSVADSKTAPARPTSLVLRP